MQEPADIELLRQYAEQNSEAAFGQLVTRYINLVYSAAARKTGSVHVAEEITQAVFIILAKKAKDLRRETILSGWLYQTARLTATNFLRNEIRRTQREKAYMQSASNETETWPEIEPLLEDAMGRLNEKERNAIVLRFFEGRSFQEIGAAFGGSENAAKKRVIRGLEKLRKFFANQGVSSTTSIIAGAISAHSVQTVPTAIAKSVTSVAMAKGAVMSGSTLTLVKGALKIMAWTKAKTAIVVGVGVLFAAGTATVCVRQINSHRVVDPRTLDESFWRLDIKTLMSAPQVAAVRPIQSRQTGTMSTETRMLARGVSLGSLLYYAYASNNIYYQFHTEYRTVLAPGVSDGKFDLLLTTTNRPQEALQAEIKKELGLVAHFEPRDMDVLVLKSADTAAPRLTPSVGNGSTRVGRGEFNFTNQPAYALVDFLQNNFDTLVNDQSGLTDYYTGRIKWTPQANKTANQREIQTALSNQLGLELIPTKIPVEMLVVEKAP